MSAFFKSKDKSEGTSDLQIEGYKRRVKKKRETDRINNLFPFSKNRQNDVILINLLQLLQSD